MIIIIITIIYTSLLNEHSSWDTVICVGSLVIIREGTCLYLMSRQHIDKLGKQLEAAAAFCAWHDASVMQWGEKGHKHSAVALVSQVFMAACEAKSRAAVAKAIKSLWFAAMLRVPEEQTRFAKEAEEAAAKLEASATGRWVAKIRETAKSMLMGKSALDDA